MKGSPASRAGPFAALEAIGGAVALPREIGPLDVTLFGSRGTLVGC